MIDLSSVDAKSIASIIGKKLSEHNIEAVLVAELSLPYTRKIVTCPMISTM